MTILTAVTGCGSSADTGADVPDYTISSQDDTGNARTVVIEVDAAKDLEAVFNDVAQTFTDEGGYFVQINCSTGGTHDVDHRLANGKKAIGNMGEVRTDLKDGQTEFEALDGKDCPTDPADDAKQEADRESAAKDAGIPPEPTGAERQQLLDALTQAAPDTVRYEDEAVDAARNQCSAINNGSTKADWAASQRFTYKDVTTTEAQGKKINDALKASGFCNV